jgi:hypothetical protein
LVQIDTNAERERAPRLEALRDRRLEGPRVGQDGEHVEHIPLPEAAAYWAKEPKSGPINARAESVANKPMFRDAFRRTRCLVAADGWFEWAREDEGMRPFNTSVRMIDLDRLSTPMDRAA